MGDSEVKVSFRLRQDSYFEIFNITQLPVEALAMGGETSSEVVGTVNVGRAGSSHSLLSVLIVSTVPVLEAELDGALDLHSFMWPDLFPRRLRFGLSL